MVFSILCTAAPAGDHAAAAALRFARAAVDCGHQLRQVFFYSDAVNIVCADPPGGGASELLADWCRFAAQHGVPLLACESALARRGLHLEQDNLPLRRGTLGQFMLAVGESERVVQFRD